MSSEFKLSKLEIMLTPITSFINRAIRMVFPSWKQTVIEEYERMQCVQGVRVVVLKLYAMTGLEHPYFDYVRRTSKGDSDYAVRHQNVINYISFDKYPFSSALYIMFKFGTIDERKYNFHKFACWKLDEEFLAGKEFTEQGYVLKLTGEKHWSPKGYKEFEDEFVARNAD